jgi:hypothetical protein
MLQKILVVLLLLTVELSTFNEYFNDYNVKIEANDIEDDSENEDFSDEIDLDKFFVNNPVFQFIAIETTQLTFITLKVTTKIPQSFQLIDSPPPR